MVDVVQEERAAIGSMRAMKSAVMGTAILEKETVTVTQTVREDWFVGRTTATGGMETT